MINKEECLERAPDTQGDNALYYNVNPDVGDSLMADVQCNDNCVCPGVKNTDLPSVYGSLTLETNGKLWLG